jgi:hypothetical protein
MPDTSDCLRLETDCCRKNRRSWFLHTPCQVEVVLVPPEVIAAMDVFPDDQLLYSVVFPLDGLAQLQDVGG